MFQLRATSTRSWQTLSHPSQDLHRAYSLLRRRSDFEPRTTSSSLESTDTATAKTPAEGTANKPVLLISRLSQRTVAHQTTHRSPAAHRGNSKAELEDDRGTDSLWAGQSPLARRTLNAESDADPHGPGTETLRGNQSLVARRSTLGAESDVGPDGREKNGRRRANRSTSARRRTSELDGRGTESLGATSFLSTQSAKSRDNAAAKWVKKGEKDLKGFANGGQNKYEYHEENGIQEEEDEEFMNESPYDVIKEMDAMSEEQLAEWERVTWPKTIQKLRDQNAAEREAVAAATYTDLKELFGPVFAPLDSPRLQALKELGGDYASYIPPGYAPARKYSMEYTRLTLGRNKEIPLKAQTEALRVIESSIAGRVTRTG